MSAESTTVINDAPPLKKIKLNNTSGPKKPQHKNQKMRKIADPFSLIGTYQQVQDKDIEELLLNNKLLKDEVSNDSDFIRKLLKSQQKEELAKYHRLVKNIEILEVTSQGEGLGLIASPFENKKKQVVIVPFALKGDIVNVHVHTTNELLVHADLVDVVRESPLRDNSLINCKYFGICQGCNYQHTEYKNQMKLKKQTIVSAYKYFAPKLFSELQTQSKFKEVVESPRKYKYRTKITPHASIAKSTKREALEKLEKNEPITNIPNLGFEKSNKHYWRAEHKTDLQLQENNKFGSILDVENCSISTDLVNNGLKVSKQKLINEFPTFKNNQYNVFIREKTTTTEPTLKDIEENLVLPEHTNATSPAFEKLDKDSFRSSTSNQRQTIQEIVCGKKFDFVANEFFQINTSILPLVIEHVLTNSKIEDVESKERYLVDAYCGSGFIGIACSDKMDKVLGVEVSERAAKSAAENAKLNNIENCKFIAGDAEKIFKEVDIPAELTTVIMDPSRKGSNQGFLDQLSAYSPAKIIYISCNVNTQARDMEYFLKETKNGDLYVIDHVTGFDFFPQTHHVESVIVLSKK
ncbi:hypothetical protein QEN19_000612 [Hanseniaspora menglaensis]